MKRNRAFTLIELLVVIAIIALLLSVVIPAMKNAKRLAAAAVCLSNEGQMVKAWLMYAEQYDSKFVDGDTSDDLVRPGYTNYGSGYVWNWVGRPMGPAKQDINDTLEDKFRGFEAGGLWPFIQAPKAYHCPADLRHLRRAVYPYNSTTGNPPGLWIGGYRTYSIGKVLSVRPASGSGEDRVTVSKVSEIINTSAKIVFLEETDGYGWNHRTWNMNLLSPQWVDPFAILHNDSSTFAYADGHADRHKWVDQQTRDMAKAQQKGWSAVDPKTGSTQDYDWFKRSYMPKQFK
ncbi:MAG TPA: type II secretion system protein [Anaerohalosphaeraceae bacterium]|nr:type II secretion system protein [Anaerohalosphaeraceae bacterium]HOL32081.1 type II secretion system protein [Anaerohalosphaeraceae bacterium]HOM75521.1 type II secretion system protein [Anaerohalosphaeraceae bacterium]HPO70003.1 type II secretion system protein [Anaerohalosphaeraceae bacterium]HRS70669.1 type II secretion system protein [Anaerohalosphaeraceae bacterium]